MRLSAVYIIIFCSFFFVELNLNASGLLAPRQTLTQINQCAFAGKEKDFSFFEYSFIGDNEENDDDENVTDSRKKITAQHLYTVLNHWFSSTAISSSINNSNTTFKGYTYPSAEKFIFEKALRI